MSGVPAIWQHVWPILDDTLTTGELAAEALPDMEQACEAAGVLIVGPPWWTIHPADQVPGWHAWPGHVLIGRAPAEPLPKLVPWRRRVDVDQAAVDRALAGQLPARHLGPAERHEAVATLAAAGLDDKQIAVRLAWTDLGERAAQHGIAQYRSRRGIPAAHPRPRAAQPRQPGRTAP